MKLVREKTVAVRVRSCRYPGCTNPVRSRDNCFSHYTQIIRHAEKNGITDDELVKAGIFAKKNTPVKDYVMQAKTRRAS